MGILFALLTALIDSVNNVLIKNGATQFSLPAVVWSWQVFSLLVFVPALALAGLPTIGPNFWWLAGIASVAHIGSLFLYSFALKTTDLSLAMPMLAFSPVITAVVSYFLTKDLPSPLGSVGVGLIIAGAYLLNLSASDRKKRDFIAPFRAIVDNKGVLAMLVIAVIWGVSSSLDQVAVRSSSPIFYSATVAIATSLLLTPFVLGAKGKELKNIFQANHLKKLVPIGILSGLLLIAQMTAINLTLAVYVIALKRSSILLSSLFGAVIFQEPIKTRLVPILTIFAGLLLIVFFQ